MNKLKNFLLKNLWSNFNLTWHKASLGEGDSSFFKWSMFFTQEVINEIAKIQLKFFFSRTPWPISIKFTTKHSWMMGFKLLTNKDHSVFKKEIIILSLNQRHGIIISWANVFLRNTWRYFSTCIQLSRTLVCMILILWFPLEKLEGDLGPILFISF